MTALLVALGAAVGAPARYVLASWLDSHPHGDRTHRGAPALPYGTLLANVLGSALLGFCVGRSLDGDLLTLLGTGFCGAFTTYSSFAVQTARLAWAPAVGYAAVTLLGGLAACALGFWLGQA